MSDWIAFFSTTAAAAAALTGLMFVVITLVVGTERVRRYPDGISTFSTPTVVHFGSALFVSVIAIVPWRSLAVPCAILAIVALVELGNLLRIVVMSRRLTGYTPDAEDWIWYSVLPFFAYLVLLAGALALVRIPRDAPFIVGASVVLLIFIGIRNAWDVVTYLAIAGRDDAP